eukprot:XP_014787300.1 PREDICTED: lens fiber major intrinsic protein-like [Octopus bimaculoides]
MTKKFAGDRQKPLDYKKNYIARRWKIFLMREIEDVRQPTFWQAAIAEFLGVTLLVCFAVASGMSDKDSPPNGLLFACISSGFFIAIIIGSLVHVSGAHVNPAVSLAFAIIGEISWIRCIFYSLTQILGSVAGAAIIRIVTPSNMHRNFGVLTPGPGVSDLQAMLMEMLITFVLIFGILAAVDKGRKDSIGSVPLHVGLIVSVNLFAAVSIALLPHF